MVNEKIEIGPALSSELIRLAVAYNDALDQCTVTNGSNLDEVMEFFADDAMRVTVGLESAVGKHAIRESFLRRSARLQQVVELRESNRVSTLLYAASSAKTRPIPLQAWSITCASCWSKKENKSAYRGSRS